MSLLQQYYYLCVNIFFSNLGQALQGDLNGKLIKNIRSEDYADLECNCNITSKVNGSCAFGGDCRKSVVL